MTTADTSKTVLHCPNCGGNIAFDSEAQQFRCASCGTVHHIEPEKDSITEYDFSEYRAREGCRMLENDEVAMKCGSCGAEFFVLAEQVAAVCPMCGAPQLRPQQVHNGIPVEGVVPFSVDRYEAQQMFSRWIKKRWFAPNSLKKLFAEGDLKGTYVPFWTYDASVEANYSGQGGRTRTRRHNGKTETYTQWFPVWGKVAARYDDIQVCASRTASGTLIQKVLPYNTSGNTRPYQPQYLSGYQAECYTIDGIEGFREAQSFIESDLRSRAHSDILCRGYSSAQVHSLQSRYHSVQYKHVLVPLWKAQYGYNGKTYRYMINGETGKVSAEYPKSPWKILLVILLVLGIVGAAFLFAEMESEPDYYLGGHYYYAAAPAAQDDYSISLEYETELPGEELPSAAV